MRGEQFWQRGGRHFPPGVIPIGEQLRPFTVLEYLDPVQRHGRLGGHSFKHLNQTGCQQPGARRVEKIRRDCDCSYHASGPTVIEDLAEREVHVEPGRNRTCRHSCGLHAGQLQCRRSIVLKHQHDLEDWVAGQRPWRIQRLDQLLERNILVGQCAQPGVPRPAE